jgi:hypothetical protein
LLRFSANISSYPHYVFSTLDHEDSGVITFGVSPIKAPFTHEFFWFGRASDRDLIKR